MNNKDLIEDVINSFVMAYKMGCPEKIPDSSQNMLYNIYKELTDRSTGEKFNLIQLLHIGPIRSFDINYCNDMNDIIVHIDFKRQDNEIAEFTAHQYGFLKKSGWYSFKFEQAAEFIHFFCRFMRKSMKIGSSYKEWLDPDEGYAEAAI